MQFIRNQNNDQFFKVVDDNGLRLVFIDSPKGKMLLKKIKNDGTYYDLIDDFGFSKLKEETFVRCAYREGVAYYDLGKDNTVVKLSTTGWELETNRDINFIRQLDLRENSIPTREGNFWKLKEYVNLDDEQFLNYIAYLVYLFSPKGDLPVLAINGDYGSAKSTLAKITKALVDPSSSDVCIITNSQKDLTSIAKNQYMLSFDNVEFISNRTSNDMCVIATGGSVQGRSLYTNFSTAGVKLRNAIVLNGVNSFIFKPDLLSRTLRLNLKSIDEESRILNSQFWEDFNKDKADILGGLFDLVVATMKKEQELSSSLKGRLTNFYKSWKATILAIGYSEEEFDNIYERSENEKTDDLRYDDPIVTTILALMESTDTWEGTASDLLDVIKSKTKKNVQDNSGFPSSPEKLGNKLTFLVQVLRRFGVICKKIKKDRKRMILISKIQQEVLESENT